MLLSLYKAVGLSKIGFMLRNNGAKETKETISSIVRFGIEYSAISFGYYLLTGITLFDSFYFTIVSMSTVGYGDISPENQIQKAYVAILVIGYLNIRFLTTLTKLVKILKIKHDLKRIGRWFTMYENHTIIYCDAKDIERNDFIFLDRLVAEMRKSRTFTDSKIVIVNRNQDKNNSLIHLFEERKADFPNVDLINMRLNEHGFFDKLNIAKASRVFALADQADDASDSDVFDFVYRIYNESDYDIGITAECVNDRNRDRLKSHGCNVIMRPNRANPELLITSTISVCSSQFIEAITQRGETTLERFELDPNVEFEWATFCYYTSLKVGTAASPIKRVDNDHFNTGELVINPNGTTVLTDVIGILIQIEDIRHKNESSIQEMILKIQRLSSKRLDLEVEI